MPQATSATINVYARPPPSPSLTEEQFPQENYKADKEKVKTKENGTEKMPRRQVVHLGATKKQKN